MRVNNNSIVRMGQETQDNGPRIATRPKSVHESTTDKFLEPASRKRSAVKKESGFGFMKAFTMANLALAGGGATNVAAYPAHGTCPMNHG